MKLIDLYSKITETNSTEIEVDDDLAFKYQRNGNLLGIGKYENGKKYGVWKEFDENKNLRGIGNYKNGERHGVWKIFNGSGNLTKIEEWKDGELQIILG